MFSQFHCSDAEDKFVTEALRTLANPASSLFPRLIGALFKHPPPSVSNPMMVPLRLLRMRDRLCESFVAVARRHGAVEVSSPLFGSGGGKVGMDGSNASKLGLFDQHSLTPLRFVSEQVRTDNFSPSGFQ